MHLISSQQCGELQFAALTDQYERIDLRCNADPSLIAHTDALVRMLAGLVGDDQQVQDPALLCKMFWQVWASGRWAFRSISLQFLEWENDQQVLGNCASGRIGQEIVR